MSKINKVWIPAIIATIIAQLLVAYYVYSTLLHGGEGRLPTGNTHRPPREGNDNYDGLFTTLGTIALFLGAASFSWYWFKKKRKSQSMWVRQAGSLLFTLHKLIGWTTLILVVIHGTYFLITKLHDDKIYSGIAAFSILLTLVGYGYFINKIRNKWMRTVHRSLGLIGVPVLLLHGGGSAIMAVIVTLAAFGLVILFERRAGQAGNE
ncbi:MAG: hypothetical protein P0Y55_18090 [Candidatus Cohnella colombiensis]|uniref:Uncharacterized protein n=1 Tax=Candidatus Cohnella colombiensis TaxID=3121368 RepID=A0AA95EVZ3_9BACL|nr:MAG: hypothetical protein P0Y55_18090 [Cohnella sp.]